MARPKSPVLTDAELRIMRVLWQLNVATVREVRDGLRGRDSLPYTTVLSALRALRSKGVVDAERRGKADCYRPLITQRQAGVDALRHLIGSFFNGAPELVALRLLEEESLTSQQLEDLKQRIEQAERREEGSS